jgi:glycosyltransferase involved in cell wall biosynthesis
MHIAIVGPIASADVAHLLDAGVQSLPTGYTGGPLLATLIGELLKRGHTVSAFTLSNDIPLQRHASVVAHGPNFTLNFSPMRPRAWQPNGWLPGRIVDLYRFEIDNLRHAIMKAAPDVVHAHWAYEFALAAIQSKVPHVVTCHDSPYTIARLASSSRPTRSLYRWLRVLMARKVFRTVQHMTAVSPYMRDQIQSSVEVSIKIVPNPIDDRALLAARPRTQPTAPRIAMVCNGWTTWKNPMPGILAFNQLRKRHPKAELHLFGADFGPGEIAASWCSTNGVLDGLVFHGSVSHHKLLDALSQLDLLLHPSLEESFGIVIAEALAMGLPVVAGQASGAVPWVVGDLGGLCDVRQPLAITQALEATLLPQRYAELSERGIMATRQRFSTPFVVDQFYALYETAIKESTPSDAKLRTQKVGAC